MKKVNKKTEFKRAFARALKYAKEYILERDNYTCVTCGASKKNGAIVQNGHLITRAKKSVLFDEMNQNAQCNVCNLKHEYYPKIYTKWFIKNYGLVNYNNLIKKSDELKKFTPEELNIIADDYKDRVDLFKRLNNKGGESY